MVTQIRKNKRNVLLIAFNFQDDYSPLGIANLKSYALKNELVRRNFNIILESYPISSFREDTLFSLVEELNPVIIGFTVWCWCKNRVLSLSNKLKARFPNITIVLGGPEIKEQYLDNKGVTFLIQGRGELSFQKLLSCFIQGGDLRAVPSLSFKENEQIATTEYDSLEDINEIPSPYLNGIIDLNRYRHPVLQVEYGCDILNCYFCDIHKKERTKKFFLLERLKEEILYILKRSDFLEIINCNLNLHHDRYVQILNFLKEGAHRNSEIILWLNHNFFLPTDIELINAIEGRKILEFELYVPKGNRIDAVQKKEIKKLSKILFLLSNENIANCLSIMLDSPETSKEKLLRLYDAIKKNVKQDNFHLHLYTRLTGKNHYDRFIPYANIQKIDKESK